MTQIDARGSVQDLISGAFQRLFTFSIDSRGIPSFFEIEGTEEKEVAFPEVDQSGVFSLGRCYPLSAVFFGPKYNSCLRVHYRASHLIHQLDPRRLSARPPEGFLHGASNQVYGEKHQSVLARVSVGSKAGKERQDKRG